MSWLCEKIPNGDVGDIATAIGMDNRISPYFLRAGVGYGGSCFPKDVKALASEYMKNRLNPDLFFVTDMINELQKDWAINTLERVEEKRKVGKIAIMGVAFKPNTDDIRDSAALQTIQYLYALGYEIIVHDPQAIGNFNRKYPHIDIALGTERALTGADVAIFLTEWDEYKNMDLNQLKELMNDDPVIIDGRRMFNKFEVESLHGIDYYGVGYYKK
jgi:UDPglucose 6-dehydrogenase